MLTFYSHRYSFWHINKRAFKNIVGNGEIARNKQFLLFPQCLLLYQIIVSPFLHIFDIISLLVAEFEEPKFGISGKGLIVRLFGKGLDFLAHLSTTCSGGAIVTGHRPASVRPSVRPLTISLKIFSSKTRRPTLIKLGRNVPWVKLYKNC